MSENGHKLTIKEKRMEGKRQKKGKSRAEIAFL